MVPRIELFFILELFVVGGKWDSIRIREKLGADMKTIHLIGHSLGAHIAGYAGERLPNLGRITGLDPAGPYFRNVANNVKLDTADATFVDVIHSNPSAVIDFGSAPYSSTVGPCSCRPSREQRCGRPCESGYKQSCGSGKPHGPDINRDLLQD
ncbi:pancreatic lipase-related protein 3 [Trichonephila clavipes]|nr:pancreatic lipase-related protein 3 [Trichonephila clavipes]